MFISEQPGTSMTQISFYDLARLSDDQRNALMQRTEADLSDYIKAVEPIIEAVKNEGDAALVRFARQFDKAEVDPQRIKATAADFDRALRDLEPEVTAAIEFAVANIKRYHQDQMPGEI
jgi:histidinol dehydrogenase